MYTSIIGFFQDGGPFMYPILVVLALGLAITIERYVYLTVTKRQNRQLLSQLLPLLKRGDYQLAFAITSKSNHIIGRMLSQGLSRYQFATHREDIEAAMEESLMEAIPRLEKRTPFLNTFAHIATLLGLLGTIIGLVKAFAAVAQVDPVQKTQMLATGVSMAMNTTAFGLMVAIPFLLFATVLQAKATEIIDSLEMAEVKFLNLMTHRKTPGH